MKSDQGPTLRDEHDPLFATLWGVRVGDIIRIKDSDEGHPDGPQPKGYGWDAWDAVVVQVRLFAREPGRPELFVCQTNDDGTFDVHAFNRVFSPEAFTILRRAEDAE